MQKMKKIMGSFTRGELLLWAGSVAAICVSFFTFGGGSLWILVASLIGVTALIYNAQGNPVGQGLMIVFSLVYGGVSYGFRYYGEMLTYLGMSMPMAVFALISWLRHPYQGNRAEVEVNALGRREKWLLPVLTAAVTAGFGGLLACLNTANLAPSIVSVTTSFLAVYLTFRRSAFFALAYAANDVVLIVLWVLAARAEARYLSMVACFAAFLVNDLYGFWSWRKMHARQKQRRPEP